MPTRQLPADPSLDHLRNQARDLQSAHALGQPDTLQRIREFHPRFSGLEDDKIRGAKFTLTDARLAIAREYGFASWPRLKRQVETVGAANLEIPYIDRIEDPEFRKAVELADSGDLDGLRDHLRRNPELPRQRVLFEGGNYFTNPSLLDFVAENPIRNDRMPANIVEIANLILEAGAKEDLPNVGHTLCLVCSGRVPREQGKQIPLIDLLCDYGADPTGALPPALAHGEFDAVRALLRRGARLTLPTAAALDQSEDVRRLIPSSTPEDRHLAIALAAQHARLEALRTMLDAGEDPSRYNPPGAHSHSTPLHQAILTGSLDVVKLLVERGARLDLEDILFHSTPLGWAEYSGQTQIATYLKSLQ